ncbi:hypothetical protein HDZ31DRAFT_45748, partial [Schizophyllum fasciatum]
PSWIRPDEQVRFRTSLSIAFEDPEGTVIKEVLRRKVFLFGEEVRPKRWVEKPRLRQCTTCWKLGHFSCNSPRCRICAGTHRTEDHRARCKGCRGALADKPCEHPPRCINCKGEHMADSPDCPERHKFSNPTNRPRPEGSAMEI